MCTGEATCALCNVLRFMWVLVEVHGLAKKVTAEKYFASGERIIINLPQWDCNAVRSLPTRRYAPHRYPPFIIIFACSMYSPLCVWLFLRLLFASLYVKIGMGEYFYCSLQNLFSLRRIVLYSCICSYLIQLITQLPQLPPFLSTDVFILTDLAVLVPRVSFLPWFCHK